MTPTIPNSDNNEPWVGEGREGMVWLSEFSQYFILKAVCNQQEKKKKNYETCKETGEYVSHSGVFEAHQWRTGNLSVPLNLQDIS